MKKSRFSEEQIIGFIKQAEAGMPIKEICRKGGFSDATFYKWRAKFGGMDVPDARRLRRHGGEARRGQMIRHVVLRRGCICFQMSRDYLLVQVFV